MEFLVDFQVNVPDGAPEREVKDRERAEASAAARLVDEGHLVRVWTRRVAGGEMSLASCRARFSGVAAQRHAEHRLRSRG